MHTRNGVKDDPQPGFAAFPPAPPPVGKTQRRGLLLSFPSSLHKFYSSSRDAPHKGRTLRSRTEGGDESTQPTFVSP